MTIGKVLEEPIHEIKPTKRNGHQGRTKAPRLQNSSFPSSFSQQPNTKKEIEREQNVWKPQIVRLAVGPRTVLSASPKSRSAMTGLLRWCMVQSPLGWEGLFGDGEDHCSGGASDQRDEFKVLGHGGLGERKRERVTVRMEAQVRERVCVSESERVRVFILFYIYIYIYIYMGRVWIISIPYLIMFYP